MTQLERFTSHFPEGFDAGIITSAPARYYFTKVTTSNGILVITKEKSYFLTDGRYIELARNTVKDCEVILMDNIPAQICEILKKHNAKVVGCEVNALTYTEFNRYKDMIAPVATLSDSTAFVDAIDDQRSVKTPDEIACLEKAQNLTDEAFQYILSRIEPGRTEKEVALDLEWYVRQRDIERIAFGFIVVSGKNSSKPHGVPSDKPIEKGDFLTIDFGVVYDGHPSDMTRTIGIDHVSDKQREIYDIVLKAQLTALDAIKPGVICKDVDKAARDVIEKAGYGEYFGHGLGHGLSIHKPMFNKTCEIPLQPGMALSVEPGIYLPGEFGVRIEDIIVCTENGHYNFTKTPKDLLILK